jgi:hypothetical protein
MLKLPETRFSVVTIFTTIFSPTNYSTCLQKASLIFSFGVYNVCRKTVVNVCSKKHLSIRVIRYDLQSIFCRSSRLLFWLQLYQSVYNFKFHDML